MNANDGQRSSLLHMVSQITLAWVALYTRGVPAEFRERRQAELESDVWEHAFNREGENDTAWKRALQMIGRLISGIPADLMWRAELISLNHSSTASRRPVMFHSRLDRFLLGAIVLLALFAIFNGVGIAFDNDMGDYAGLWGVFFVIPAITILTGLVAMRRSHPRLGGTLVVLGAAANIGVYSWLWPIMLVISGFIMWFAVTRARRLIELTRATPVDII
jgi:hypothetical protein